MLKKFSSIIIVFLILFTSIFSVGAETYSKEDIASYIEKIITYKMNVLSVSNKEDFIYKLSENTDNSDTQWLIIALSKYGYDMSSVSSSLQASALKSYQENAKATDLQRVSIALSACGVNIENVGGKNLLADSTYNNASLNRQGINAYAYALITLEKADIKQSVNAYIEEILDLQLADGGFALTGNYADTDVTAICIQALAPFINENKKVQESIEKALTCLSKKQNEDGSYSSFGVKNCESIAQVISALVATGVKIEEDNRFIKNGKNAVDALIEYQNFDGSFVHISGGKANSMATVQALIALVDYNAYLMSDDRDVFPSVENDKVETNVTATKATEISDNTIEYEIVENETVKKQDILPATTSAVQDVKVEESQNVASDNNISTPDEIYISDKQDNLVSVPTKSPVKKADSYSDYSIFVISISGLLVVFVILLSAKIFIAKKSGEKFNFSFIKRNEEDDEEDI